MKKLFLTILAVMLAGCVTNFKNDLNIAKSVPEKKAGNLSRALVPVNRLISLSKESVIWSIKLPNKLIKPNKTKP